MSSSGPIQGQGSTPLNQYNTDALDQAEKTDIVRIKGNKIKVGTSEGSFLNRKVRKRLGNFSGKMRASYEQHAQKATQKQRDAAFEKVQEATGHRYESKSVQNRKVTVAEVKTLLTPHKPNIPDENVTRLVLNPEATHNEIYSALADASKGLDLAKGSKKVYASKEVAGGARFGNILPPKHSNIEVDGRPFAANNVGESYIAAQGPNNAATNRESIALMHQMLYEQDTETVVNLTRDADLKRMAGHTLALHYWPEEGATEVYSHDNGSIEVTTSDWQKGEDYDVITLSIAPQGLYTNTNDNPAKEVKVFQYHKWPDHGAPSDESFGRFSRAVDANGELGKTVVHCKAGVGRTGTFIVTQQLKEEAREGNLNRFNLLSRATELVWEGRKDRGPSFVQTAEQFNFIIEELEREFDRLDEQGSTVTSSTDLGSLSDLDKDELTSVQTESFVPPQSPPPGYTAPTAESFMTNWYNGTYSEGQMYEAIAAMDSLEELNKLYNTIAEFDKPDIPETDSAFYKNLMHKITGAERYL